MFLKCTETVHFFLIWRPAVHFFVPQKKGLQHTLSTLSPYPVHFCVPVPGLQYPYLYPVPGTVLGILIPPPHTAFFCNYGLFPRGRRASVEPGRGGLRERARRDARGASGAAGAARAARARAREEMEELEAEFAADPGPGFGGRLRALADRWNPIFRTRVMPFWMKHSIDDECGGHFMPG